MVRNLETVFPDPRDEYEMCSLFGDLLFMRLDRDISNESHQRGLQLNAAARQKLIGSDIINRVFRSWYQTTWGNTDWRDDFAGNTPRQELSAFRPDIGTGDALLSVALEEKILSPLSGDGTGGARLEAIPRLFTRDALSVAGGAFMYGLHELEKNKRGVVAPNYDPDFRRFAQKLERVKQFAESLASYNLADLPPETVYWRLFIDHAIADVLSFLPLSLDEKPQMRLHGDMVTILMGAMGLQKDGEFDYISIDALFGYFWHAISRCDRTLLSYADVMSNSRDDIGKRMENERSAHSQAMLYRLGHAFDEHFLFPADSYWGAVEIVWQDKITFMNNLGVTLHLLTHPRFAEKEKMSKSDRKRYTMFGMEHTLNAVSGMWFNPPTCFRVHPKGLTII